MLSVAFSRSGNLVGWIVFVIYINVPYKSKNYFIDWNWLNGQKIIKELKFVKHVRLISPLKIKLDGRRGSALVLKPSSY